MTGVVGVVKVQLKHVNMCWTSWMSLKAPDGRVIGVVKISSVGVRPLQHELELWCVVRSRSAGPCRSVRAAGRSSTKRMSGPK